MSGRVNLRVHSPGIYSVVFSPLEWYDHLRLRDTETWEQKQVFTGHTALISDVVFSPDGKTLATVRLWDTETGEHKDTLTGHTHWVEAVAFGWKDTHNTLRLWDTETGKPKGTLIVVSVFFSPDGKTLVGRSSIRCGCGIPRRGNRRVHSGIRSGLQAYCLAQMARPCQCEL